MQSGIFAARAIFQALKAGEPSAEALAAYDRMVDGSYITHDLYRSRNMRLAFKEGFLKGGAKAALMSLTGGRLQGPRIEMESDAAVLHMAEVADQGPSRYRKTIVTEEALRVSPDLIGLTLARPWRRLCAILLDTLLVSILAKELGVFFGFAAAYVLFRVSFRPTPAGSYLKRSFRFLFRVGGAVVLFLAVWGLWRAIGDRFGDEDGGSNGSVRAEITVDDEDDVGGELSLTPMQGLRFGADMVSLTTADNEEEARDAATKLLASMRAAGATGTQARETVREVAGGMEDRPWLAAAVEPVLQADQAGDAESPPPAEEAVADSGAVGSEDSVILAYGAAFARGDSARTATTRAAGAGG